MTFAESAAWENERRKVNIQIFAIWNMHVLPATWTAKVINFGVK